MGEEAWSARKGSEWSEYITVYIPESGSGSSPNTFNVYYSAFNVINQKFSRIVGKI